MMPVRQAINIFIIQTMCTWFNLSEDSTTSAHWPWGPPPPLIVTSSASVTGSITTMHTSQSLTNVTIEKISHAHAQHIRSSIRIRLPLPCIFSISILLTRTIAYSHPFADNRINSRSLMHASTINVH